MTEDQFKELKPGDFIIHHAKGPRMKVLSNENGIVSAVRVGDIEQIQVASQYHVCK